jgi:hypothetical protein
MELRGETCKKGPGDIRAENTYCVCSEQQTSKGADTLGLRHCYSAGFQGAGTLPRRSLEDTLG